MEWPEALFMRKPSWLPVVQCLLPYQPDTPPGKSSPSLKLQQKSFWKYFGPAWVTGPLLHKSVAGGGLLSLLFLGFSGLSTDVSGRHRSCAMLVAGRGVGQCHTKYLECIFHNTEWFCSQKKGEEMQRIGPSRFSLTYIMSSYKSIRNRILKMT